MRLISSNDNTNLFVNNTKEYVFNTISNAANDVLRIDIGGIGARKDNFAILTNNANVDLRLLCVESFVGGGAICLERASNSCILSHDGLMYDSRDFGLPWQLIADTFQMERVEYVEAMVVPQQHGFSVHSLASIFDKIIFASSVTASGKLHNMCGRGIDKGMVVRYDQDGNMAYGKMHYGGVHGKMMTLHNIAHLEARCGGKLPAMPFFDRTSDALAYMHEGQMYFFVDEVLLDEDPCNLSVIYVDWQFKRIGCATIFRGVRGSANYELKTLNTSITISGYTDENPFACKIVEDKFGNALDHNGDVIPFFAKWTILHKNSLVPPVHRKPIKYRRGCDFKRAQSMPYRVMRK
jgi:hypothetical protein